MVRYSKAWWFWSREGRSIWKKCKRKGNQSAFWKRHKCDTRVKPAKGSKWWWWTKSGRKVWKDCEEKGESSSFWKDNDCGSGRCDCFLHAYIIFFVYCIYS